MKKIAWMIAAFCAVLVIVGCASGPSASEMMRSAKSSAPDGTLIGQASGSVATKAETDAKYQVTRAIGFIVQEMINEAVEAKVIAYTPAEEFRQSVNTALLRNNLSAAVKQDSGVGAGKVYWAVYYLEKADAIKVINSAVTAAKELHPAAAAFSTEAGINKAFNAAANREWKN
jgi:predicted nucleic-acid-binding protein